ncbi:MAG: C45 family autoproteolytic acyltransferase/hydrolase [Bacillota bacterium]
MPEPLNPASPANPTPASPTNPAPAARPRLDRPCLVRSFAGTALDLGRFEAGLILDRDTPRHRLLRESWGSVEGGAARGGAAASTRLREGEALLETLARVDPPLVDENRGLAEGLGLRPEAIASFWARRTPAPERAGCTLFAVSDPHHQRTLLGRNFDLRVEDIERRLLICRPTGGGSSSRAPDPGAGSGGASIGGCGGLIGRLDGVNDRGLAAAAAEVFVDDAKAFWGPAGPPAGALDCGLVLRIILDRCATVDEAVALARDIPQWTAFNFLVADRTGAMAVIEYAGQQTQVRRPLGGGSPPGRASADTGPARVAATNHYESPPLRGFSRDGSLTHRRYARLLEALRDLDRPGAVTPEAIHLSPGRPDLNPYRPFEVGGSVAYAEELPVVV